MEHTLYVIMCVYLSTIDHVLLMLRLQATDQAQICLKQLDYTILQARATESQLQENVLEERSGRQRFRRVF